MQQNKSAASYFTFIILIFLGIFIYMGWMLSSNSTINNKNIADNSSTNTPAMTVNTSKNKDEETIGIQLIPEKPENIKQSFIADVKPIVDKEIEAKPIPEVTEQPTEKTSEKTISKSEKIKTAEKAASPVYTPKQSNIYIVRHNDTLTGIAKQTLGSARRWREIARLNSDILPNPHNLKPGIRLRLPDKSSDVTEKNHEIKFQTYTVRKTDSLYSLAVRFYGTPKAAGIIRKANADTLSGTSDLTEGMVLKIPQRSASSAAADSFETPSGEIKYRVKSGDTLSEIAKRFYNSSISYDKILKANPEIKDVKNLKVGSVITIPAKK